MAPTVSGGSGWTVTSQVQGQEIADNGQLLRGWTVSYRMGNGTTGSVFVPNALYTPDNVRAAIAEQAAMVAAVHGLSSAGGQ